MRASCTSSSSGPSRPLYALHSLYALWPSRPCKAAGTFNALNALNSLWSCRSDGTTFAGWPGRSSRACWSRFRTWNRYTTGWRRAARRWTTGGIVACVIELFIRINFHALYLRAKIWNIPNTVYAWEEQMDTKRGCPRSHEMTEGYPHFLETQMFFK